MGILANYGNSVVVAGAGLGVMFINMFVYGTFEGLNGAIDTLVSQYYGAKDYQGCNEIFNKGRIINTVFFLPVALLLIYSDSLLILLNQDPDVAWETKKFLVYQIPGLFMIAQFDTLRRYMQAQEKFDVPAKGLIISNIFHITTLTTVMHYVKYDPIILCAVITNFSMIIDYCLLYYFSKDLLKETNYLNILDGAFIDWCDYLELAIPSAFIICAEWWMYEVLALFAGLLGVNYLAAIVIIFNTHNFVYDISYGLSQAASTMIGGTLSRHGVEEAKKLLYVISLMQGVLCAIMILVYTFLPRQIIGIFTDETEIMNLYLDCILYILVMFVIDSTQIVIGGVIRGIGEQGESSIISFIAYGLITLPLSILFSFWFDMKLQGILLGYILGILFNTVMNVYILIKSEWKLSIEQEEDENSLNL